MPRHTHTIRHPFDERTGHDLHTTGPALQATVQRHGSVRTAALA